MDKKLVILGVVSVALIGGAYGIGSTQAKTKLDDTVLTIKSAEEKKVSLQTDVEKIETTLEDLKTDIDSKRDELSEAKLLIDKKDSLVKEVDTLAEDISDKEKESETLKKDIENKNKEIEKLEKGIVELKSKPRELPAGNFVVGSDIDAGRYKVIPNGGTMGNFFVNDGMDANVLLGNDSYSVSEYIVTLSDGDDIEQSIPVKYQLVE